MYCSSDFDSAPSPSRSNVLKAARASSGRSSMPGSMTAAMNSVKPISPFRSESNFLATSSIQSWPQEGEGGTRCRAAWSFSRVTEPELSVSTLLKSPLSCSCSYAPRCRTEARSAARLKRDSPENFRRRCARSCAEVGVGSAGDASGAIQGSRRSSSAVTLSRKSATRHRSTNSRERGDCWAQSFSGSGGSASPSETNAETSSKLKGRFPVSSVWTTTPRDHTSQRKS
mmetsp:Transcript_23440/g.66894  ORF Transcript_23440/g.66894 Transcript_23440/m.66894 type:complete len:228 (+) Transcript_23440:212-895(+)